MPSHYATLKDAAASFITDRTFSRAAALAFYTLFSLAPLLIIAIALIGVFFDESAARHQIVQQLGAIVGGKSADVIEGLLKSVATPTAGPAALLGIATLLIGATSVFAELKDGLDQIWDLPPAKTRGVLYLLRKRLLSFGLVLAIGFLLLVSLLFSAAVAALQAYLALSDSTGIVLEALNSLCAYLLVTAMFAIIYKWLPGTRVEWRDATIGAVATASFFEVGKFLIGYYLGTSGVESAYGAAGSVILMLLWVYYSALIFLLGAHFTRAYSRHDALSRKTEDCLSDDRIGAADMHVANEHGRSSWNHPGAQACRGRTQ